MAEGGTPARTTWGALRSIVHPGQCQFSIGVELDAGLLQAVGISTRFIILSLSRAHGGQTLGQARHYGRPFPQKWPPCGRRRRNGVSYGAELLDL